MIILLRYLGHVVAEPCFFLFNDCPLLEIEARLVDQRQRQNELLVFDFNVFIDGKVG